MGKALGLVASTAKQNKTRKLARNGGGYFTMSSNNRKNISFLANVYPN
jgi:hypothetical protein